VGGQQRQPVVDGADVLGLQVEVISSFLWPGRRQSRIRLWVVGKGESNPAEPFLVSLPTMATDTQPAAVSHGVMVLGQAF